MALSISPEYGYVLAAITSTVFVNMFHTYNTSMARKAAKVDYPATYASEERAAKDPKAYRFNCAQRSHANFTEVHTSAVIGMAVAGLYYPTVAGYLGAMWSAGRLAYGIGYTSGGPKGRIAGSIVAGIGVMTLNVLAVYGTYQLITSA
jgi:glutathione S-transferase